MHFFENGLIDLRNPSLDLCPWFPLDIVQVYLQLIYFLHLISFQIDLLDNFGELSNKLSKTDSAISSWTLKAYGRERRVEATYGRSSVFPISFVIRRKSTLFVNHSVFHIPAVWTPSTVLGAVSFIAIYMGYEVNQNITIPLLNWFIMNRFQ